MNQHYAYLIGFSLLLLGTGTSLAMRDSSRPKPLDDRTMATIQGGVFAACANATCPHAATCFNNQNGTSTYYYNNGYNDCGIGWSSCARSTNFDGSFATVPCYARNYSAPDCKTPDGDQYVSTNQTYCGG